MTKYVFENFTSGVTLTEAVTTSATTIKVGSASAALLPQPSTGQQATLLLYDGTNAPEIVLVAASGNDASGDITVTRAQEGTVAVAWAAGTKVAGVITDTFLNNVGTTAEYVTQTELITETESAVTAGATATITLTAPLAQVGDAVQVQCENFDLIVFAAECTTLGQIACKVYNPTGSTITPTSGSWRAIYTRSQ